ncbi:uncharacterized protein TNCT_510821 [Trichonephila clavata]|uniref:Uncharacterized protein n=1 Tax=Trichonephila clavata TaxID=2740835 RepID=A0A8X6GWQ5_TRICU|nr:uncharacterized protein TNCT_510821 [Trichonephila clavata]
MNPEEKKRLANEKRLKAIQDWKNRKQQPIKVEAKAVRKTYDEPEVKSNDKNKLTLFDSDGEDNYENDFNIRPQFEGEKGQKLLERNSYLSSRFKLDERFKEDDDEEIPKIPVTEEQEEKIKNMKILESILGYEVVEKYNTEGQKLMKRNKMVRFDPEDKNASELLETPVEKPPKEPRKKQKVEEKTEEKEIPVSSERYIEVNANLKDLLHSSAPTFSLSEKFSNEIENVNDFSFSFPTKEDLQSNKEIQKDYIKTPVTLQDTKNIFEDGKKFLFFISEDDEMLKEGVEFFRRKESLNELYEKCNQRKVGVQELFKRKRKIFEKGSAPKSKRENENRRYGRK